MSYFRSRRKGRVHVEMPASSGLLISDLARQLVELLSDGEATSAPVGDPLEELVEMDSPRLPPTDPALLRLFPDAHRGDAEAAAEFRRFTEQTLRRGKIEAAQVVITSIGEVEAYDATDTDADATAAEETIELELGPEQARAWMKCLTDLRLTLAARLGIAEANLADAETGLDTDAQPDIATDIATDFEAYGPGGPAPEDPLMEDPDAGGGEDAWLALPPDDPRGVLYRIYGWLGYQLESLLDAAQ